MAYDERLADRIRSVLSARTDVVEKEMFGGIAFMVRGHMACGVVGECLMVRVDPGDNDALLREPHARPMNFTGRTMRGFLYVDPPGIATLPALRKWVHRAVEFAAAKPVKSKAPRPAASSRARPAAAPRTRARKTAPASRAATKAGGRLLH